RLLIFALEPRVPECSARLSWPTGPDPRRPCTRGITTAAGRTKGCGKALRSADPATLPISPPRIERRRVIGGLISEHRRAAQRAGSTRSVATNEFGTGHGANLDERVGLRHPPAAQGVVVVGLGSLHQPGAVRPPVIFWPSRSLTALPDRGRQHP